MPTLHLIIKGQVQGVFFRATAKDIAEEIGITGWIKNTAEGNVEAMVTGTHKQLERFVEWCKKGPRMARVAEVIATECEEKLFTAFSIER